jgi:hypothetical protein
MQIPRWFLYGKKPARVSVTENFGVLIDPNIVPFLETPKIILLETPTIIHLLPKPQKYPRSPTSQEIFCILKNILGEYVHI